MNEWKKQTNKFYYGNVKGITMIERIKVDRIKKKKIQVQHFEYILAEYIESNVVNVVKKGRSK